MGSDEPKDELKDDELSKDGESAGLENVMITDEQEQIIINETQDAQRDESKWRQRMVKQKMETAKK